jgi:serine-type D-Ala-D-Ala carboxypeptidase/endopeptidase
VHAAPRQRLFILAAKRTDGRDVLCISIRNSERKPTMSSNTHIPAATPSPVDGIWLGHLAANNRVLRVQLIVKTDQAGHQVVVLNSIDQRGIDLACVDISFSEGRFAFEVPSIHGCWSGTLSADFNRLTGQWNQFTDLPLNFDRQSEITRGTPPPPPRMLPALPPVPVAELGAQLSRDFEAIVTDGWLSPGSAGGVVIGVVQGSERSIVSFGAADATSIFEIGSVSKTFTGLLLAQMVAQGQAQLDEPLRELLPRGIVQEPAQREMTLLDLSTHHSGLPRLPTNMRPADLDDPYADFDAEKLLEFIAAYGTGKPEKPGCSYSNLGVGMLGYALANRAGKPFDELLREQVLDPLGMNDTAIALTSEQQRRFIQGHKANGKAAHPWDLNVLAGAGGLRASVADMLRYLEAFGDPSSVRDAVGLGGRTLSQALEDAQRPRVEVSSDMAMCLGWFYRPENETHWHTGGTGGFTSYAAFSRLSRRAIVVQVNTAGTDTGSPATVIGRYIGERLDGREAIWPGTVMQDCGIPPLELSEDRAEKLLIVDHTPPHG